MHCVQMTNFISKPFPLTKYMAAGLLCVLCINIPGTARGESEIRMARQTNSGLSDKGEPYVKCALSKMNRPYSITKAPWKRVQKMTEAGKFDGYYMATQNDKRDQYADVSWKFIEIKWLFVVKKGSSISPEDADFPDKKFAVNLGSARHLWLAKKIETEKFPRNLVSTTSSLSSLKMVALGRVDVTLENDQNLDLAFSTSELSRSDFDYQVAKVKYAGVYFSKEFLKKETGFLEHFNKSLKLCKTGS